MITYLYDKTFEGFLTAIFLSYQTKIFPDNIISNHNYQASLLSETIEISTDIIKAERVMKSIVKRTSKEAFNMIYHVFVSELDDVEFLLYKYLELVFKSNYDVSENIRDEYVLRMKQIQRKVLREAHRMLMFVRFQNTSQEIYFSPIDPNYDVIPLIGKHFKKRFTDQQWIIYDTRRNYGIYYDLKEVKEVKFESIEADKSTGKLNASILEEYEGTYQQLWQTYYDSINIPERKNLKLRMQLMPKRLWKYLPEIR